MKQVTLWLYPDEFFFTLNYNKHVRSNLSPDCPVCGLPATDEECPKQPTTRDCKAIFLGNRPVEVEDMVLYQGTTYKVHSVKCETLPPPNRDEPITYVSECYLMPYVERK